MEEDDPTPGQTNEFVLSMLEDMRLQHQEHATLVNECISTLSDQVQVQNEQFSLHTAAQEQRFNMLSDMIATHSAKFDAFISTFLQRFPLALTPDDDQTNP